MASIDIAAMSGLISELGSAEQGLRASEGQLVSALSGAGVDAGAAAGLSVVAGWLGGQVPGLARRLSLAQAIEAASPSRLSVIRIDERMVSTMSTVAAVALGRADARRLTSGGGGLDAAVLAQIAKYRNDPYFASVGCVKDLGQFLAC